jgi:hypothetical protein
MMKKMDRPILTLVHTADDLTDRQQVQHDDGDHHEDAERLELSQQVRLGALLDRPGDVLHFLGALASPENRLHQRRREAERHERHDRRHDHEGQILAGQGKLADGDAPDGHSLSSCTNTCMTGHLRRRPAGNTPLGSGRTTARTARMGIRA